MENKHLWKAETIAKSLSPQKTKESEEAIRDRIARQFFGEAGIPKELKEGWAVLEQLRENRLKVGYPLPPGGCLLLGREAAVAGCLAEMHTALANMLRISVDRIKLRLERNDLGQINPVADIDVPNDWVVPIAGTKEDPNEAAKTYLAACVRMASHQFRIMISDRLQICDDRRLDIVQEMAPWGHHGP